MEWESRGKRGVGVWVSGIERRRQFKIQNKKKMTQRHRERGVSQRKQGFKIQNAKEGTFAPQLHPGRRHCAALRMTSRAAQISQIRTDGNKCETKFKIQNKKRMTQRPACAEASAGRHREHERSRRKAGFKIQDSKLVRVVLFAPQAETGPGNGFEAGL